MNELITINEVRGRLDSNGNPELNLEDVARGLGFTQRQNKNGKVYESIRWERIYGHLDEFGIPPQVGESGYIPENIFYKLCFKAESKIAIAFQDKVTDEVLPSIRKNGAYMTPQKIEEALLNPDTIIQLATSLKEERTRNQILEEKNQEMLPKAEFYDTVADSKDGMTMSETSKMLGFKGYGRTNMFDFLREVGVLQQNNEPYQTQIDAGRFSVVMKSYEWRGKNYEYTQTLVTPKGIDYIRKLISSYYV